MTGAAVSLLNTGLALDHEQTELLMNIDKEPTQELSGKKYVFCFVFLLSNNIFKETPSNDKLQVHLTGTENNYTLKTFFS